MNETSLRLEKNANQYAEKVKDQFGASVVSIVLFGSVARGDATNSSDIDLFLVFEDELPVSRPQRHRLLNSVEEQLEKELKPCPVFSAVIKTRKEAGHFFPLYLDMVDEAKILFDKNDFFAEIMKRMHATLKRLGSKRVTLGKIRYWNLKPDHRPGEHFEIEI